MRLTKSFKIVDGNDIIYHYIQKNLIIDDNEFSKKIVEKLIIDLSIWLPPTVYKEIPILLPYVIRDASCRKSNNKTCEEWGSSNCDGFLRDDNSLIKGIVKSFTISSPIIKKYNKKRLGKGFVASHVWREIEINNLTTIASKYHKTYSFVPNLVWLPKQISKLTDREGSYAQKILQTLSYKIYRKIETNIKIEKIWNYLKNPCIQLDIGVNSLNYFKISDNWIENRKEQLIKDIENIEKVLNKNRVERGIKVKCSRYLQTIINIEEFKKEDLINWLDYYKDNILN